MLHRYTPLLQPIVASVRWGKLPPTLQGQTWPRLTGSSEVLINGSYRNKNPLLYAPILAHEALHTRSIDNSLPQEVVASFAGVLVYLNLLHLNPALSGSGTKLNRVLNLRAATLLNSGRGARVGLSNSNGTEILPHRASSERIGSFMSNVHQDYSDTPISDGPSAAPGIEPLLEALQKRMNRRKKAPRGGNLYDEALIACLDSRLQDGTLSAPFLEPQGLVKLAETLGLQPPGTTAE
ncbi:MAG: hypothetical protein C4333_02385 [Meiothermus sp.]